MGLGSCGGQRTARPTIRDERIAHQTIVWVRFTGVLAINVHYSDPQSRPQTGPLAQFGARIFADWRPASFTPISIVLEQKLQSFRVAHFCEEFTTGDSRIFNAKAQRRDGAKSSFGLGVLVPIQNRD